MDVWIKIKDLKVKDSEIDGVLDGLETVVMNYLFDSLRVEDHGEVRASKEKISS